jgi:hypothetical protein
MWCFAILKPKCGVVRNGMARVSHYGGHRLNHARDFTGAGFSLETPFCRFDPGGVISSRYVGRWRVW